jgi:signal peptidase
MAHAHGASVYVVRSNSMSPTLRAGDAAVVVPADRYEVGDVITFRRESGVVTHRVVAVTEDGYQTQGDANEEPDAGLVPPTAVQGKMWRSAPGAGYALVYLRQPAGLLSVAAFLLEAGIARTLLESLWRAWDARREGSCVSG